MYLAYLDESGDSGLVRSPTRFFVLCCVLVHEAHWLETLDMLVGLRRSLKNDHAIPTRPEIKSTDIRWSRGVLRALRWSLDKRMRLFRKLLRFEDEGLNLKTFCVAIEKAPAQARGWEPRYAAWTFAIQRINRFCGNQEWATLYPDQGHGMFIRKRLRHMRRYHVVPGHYGPKTIPFPVQRIVEDPNERVSQDSYFIQIADWNAYAAHRSKHVDPICPVADDLWDELESTRLLEVNAVRGGPPGIVRYP